MYKTGIRFAATLLLTILLVAFVIVPAVDAATIPFTVYGTVSGNSGGSVTVSIASLGMSTSTSGYYQLSGNSFVPGNTYTVTASASGYDTASAQFTVPVENGSKQQIDLHMTKTATATPNPATATPNPVTATPNPVTATPNPGTPTPTSQSSNGDPASYSIGLVVVNETATPSPTVEPTITPTPTAEPTVTPTPTSVPLPTTTAQTSPDWTCLLFLLGLLIAFIIGYLAGRKHEQMKQGKKEQPKQP